MPYHLLLALPFLFPFDRPANEDNPLLRAATEEGLAVGEVRVKVPKPTFRDGQSAEEQRAALVGVAGSSRAADEMLQASISAPHKLRTTDVKAEGVILRTADLHFIIRGVDLDAIEPREAFGQIGDQKVEAANIRFELRGLKAEDLKDIPQATPSSDDQWLIHSKGRLLDRISVESTDRVAVTRSADSMVFASAADPKFGPDSKYPNRWSTIALKATGDAFGPSQPYAGSIGYVKLTRLKGLEKVIAVEAHLAYAEPLAWFDGAPILRSKFGLIAQDQVRRLRRELAKEKR